MVVRDADLLAELGARRGCTVCLSVPTVDEDAWRALEPGTAHPLQRLRAVRQLRDAGVNAGVLMAPVVPGFTTQPAKLEATIKAIADHGAAFMGANVHVSEGRDEGPLHGVPRAGVPAAWWRATTGSMPGAYAQPDYVEHGARADRRCCRSATICAPARERAATRASRNECADQRSRLRQSQFD